MTKQTFFIQVPPGLEQLAKKEFILKFINLGHQVPEPTVEMGGLLVELPLEVGVKLNYWLKIPNRILLRLAQFKCRDLPKLFNKISKLPLSSYFAGQEFNFQISSSQSRLFDSRKIEKALVAALENNFKKQEPKKKAKDKVQQWHQWRLYCRFQDDWCDISIDTSGERLGKRGDKIKVGKAPLRENLASALYFATLQSLEKEWIDQIYQGEKSILLVDPYAGSGTLLSESTQFFKPAIKREFSFSYFPIFIGKEELIKAPQDPELKHNMTLVAGEYSEQQYLALEENLKSMNNQDVHMILGDSFNGNLNKVLHELQAQDSMAFSITNPPYGKRVQVDQRVEVSEILKNIFSLYPFQLVGVLMPKEFSLQVESYCLINKVAFSHGGTDVIYSLWKSEESK